MTKNRAFHSKRNLGKVDINSAGDFSEDRPIRPTASCTVAIAVLLSIALCPFTVDASQYQVNLYFPHALLGGADSNRWSAEVIISSQSSTDGSIDLEFISEKGVKQHRIQFVPTQRDGSNATIRPLESRQFVVRGHDSPQILKGWIRGESTVPVLSTLTLKRTTHGSLAETIRVPSMRPTSSASFQLLDPTKVFLLNRDEKLPVSIEVQINSATGKTIRSEQITVPPHTLKEITYNLGQVGYLRMTPSISIGELHTFVAGSTSAKGFNQRGDSTVSSGGHGHRLSHRENLMFQFRVMEDTAKFVSKALSDTFRQQGNTYYANKLRNSFDSVRLEVPEGLMVNAYARNASTIGVSLGLVQLFSDSPSELAFVIGHEFGHIFQQRTSELTFDLYNIEADADMWGALLSLIAGRDVYASAGALSKLAMVTGNSSLANQIFEDVPYFEAHRSINTRMSAVFDMLVTLCNLSNWRQLCSDYKRVAHPNLPSIAPLFDRRVWSRSSGVK